jgi:hypothetical protein
MITRHVQCVNCSHSRHADIFELARTASRLFCPLCHVVTQFAEAQMRQPGISPQAKNEWGLISQIALGIGVGIALNKLFEWADS